jgi:glycosyltransferase involved in cell wall biosynthesis
MKIGIDARYLSHGLVGGVHTYIQHFLPALIDVAAEHTLLVYADTKRAFDLDASQWPARASLVLLPYKNGLSSIKHDLFMARQLARDGVEVVHFPANTGTGPANARTVLTLHDEINILPVREIWRGHQKSLKTMAMMTYLHAMSSMAVHRASVIVTVSEYAKRRIAEVGKINPDRIHVVPHAPTPQFKRIEDPVVLAEVRKRHALPARFVLADALKNPAVLVRAWRMLPAELRADRKIVFFARRPDVLPIVTEAAAAGDAVLLQRPPREDLIALYSMADAFAFPSWIEGFGIPVLEAMICGAPVLASDRGSIPEVAGNAALISDAEDAVALAANLTRVLSDEATALTLRNRGLTRAAQFTWRKTAEQLLQAYEIAMYGGGLTAATAHPEMP